MGSRLLSIFEFNDIRLLNNFQNDNVPFLSVIVTSKFKSVVVEQLSSPKGQQQPVLPMFYLSRHSISAFDFVLQDQ